MKGLDLTYEHELGVTVAGIDEVGRGPLAGPVVAACVIIDKHIEDVCDSKKLEELKRIRLAELIKEKALAYSVGIVEHDIIDEINILNATKRAFREAYDKISVKPDVLLIDGRDTISCGCECRAIINGDNIVYSIAAASIVAKVFRDSIMIEMDALYPQYGFARNKGYGTKEHIEAIKKYGVTPIHRRSFFEKVSLAMNKRKVGSEAEQMAVLYLKKHGAKIMQTNYFTRAGEIDIVFQDGDTLCFCEVKYRTSDKFGTPAEAVNRRKREHLSQAALQYIYLNDVDAPCRFDVIEVYELDLKGINHIKNAFGFEG